MSRLAVCPRWLPFVLGLGAFFACAQGPQPAQDQPPAAPRPAGSISRTPADRVLEVGGHARAIDRDGVPRFIWGVGSRRATATLPAAAAKEHLAAIAPAFAVAAREVDKAELLFVRDMGTSGVVAKWRQQVDGVPLYPGDVTLLMNQQRELVASSGRLYTTSERALDFDISEAEALRTALARHFSVDLAPEDVQDAQRTPSEPGRLRFVLAQSAPLWMLEPAQVKRILYTKEPELEPAYVVEFYAAPAGDADSVAFRYILSAADGRVLEQSDLTAHEAFSYRVWADPVTFWPADGPRQDFSPHPTGTPDGSQPALIASSLVTVEGFNRGGLAPDPWLPADAQQSLGNNVDAYADHDQPDGFSGDELRAAVTSSRTFDRTFDFAQQPHANDSQIMASVTEIFYVTNWLHDYWYDSGFDEPAGNAQLDNYGRGGIGGDRLLAETQNGLTDGLRGSASMASPSDGMSPRLQVPNITVPPTATLSFSPGGSVLAGVASFGPQAFDLTATVAVSSPLDACTAVTNSVSGQIALVDRGVCPFPQKVQFAQAAGAVGVIIADNVPGTTPPPMNGTNASLTVAALSMLQSDANTLRVALGSGPVTAHMMRAAAAVDREGSLDHTTVAHEFGHLLHHRLANCAEHQCQAMSEGWGDFVALHMMIGAGDDPLGAYAIGPWLAASDPQSSFFGIRRVTYSADHTKNALTFRDIADDQSLPATAPLQPNGAANSEVHNAGEVWATMLTEAYVALLQQTLPPTNAPFEEIRRRMADYVVTGLQLTPSDATFTEARDAILAAARARSPSDALVLAQAFARRGAGNCAQSPPAKSSSLNGVVESNALQPRIVIQGVTIDDDVWSCDDDGILDAQEIGTIRVVVGNSGPVPLDDVTLTVSSTSAGVSLPAGPSVQLAAIAPFATGTAELEIELDADLAAIDGLQLAIAAESAAACETLVTRAVVERGNYDMVSGSTSDDVESSDSAWTTTGVDAAEIWQRTQLDALESAWLGLDVATPSDTSLVSPVFAVSPSASFIVALDHRYQFEVNVRRFDGGVIEYSVDGGQTWADVSTLIDPGYPGTLDGTAGNPLANRRAFSGQNAAWPARNHLTLDFGTALAGQSVQLRFRIGTDASGGSYGWELDDFAVQGITNAPFTALAADDAVCPDPIVADAGSDRTVDAGELAALDASQSVSLMGRPLSYAWTQSAGEQVQLADADTANPSFEAPVDAAEQVLRFEVELGDGVRTATDTVEITVRATPPTSVNADAGPDQTVTVESEVVLDGSNTTTTGSQPLTYAWVQTDGPEVALTDADSAVARFVAPVVDADTPLSFELTVSDAMHSSTDTVEVTVAAYALIANAGGDQSVTEGQRVELDGSDSSSPIDSPLTYGWSQQSGPSVTLVNANATVAEFVAPRVDTLAQVRFELSVSDGVQSATDSIIVNVQPMSTADVGAGPDAGTDAGADSADVGAGPDAGTDAGADSGSGSDSASASGSDSGSASDGGDGGADHRSGGDSGCDCSSAPGHGRSTGLGSLAMAACVLLALKLRRRRVASFRSSLVAVLL